LSNSTTPVPSHVVGDRGEDLLPSDFAMAWT